MSRLPDTRDDMTGGPFAPHEAQAESLSNQQSSTPCSGAAVTLRVAEARVEDVGHAIARLAPGDLLRTGAKPGDTLKITGGTVAVGRAEISDDAHEGVIQIDGTCRSNCSAGLQEQGAAATVETQEAVAVRLTPMWIGAAPATIAPERMLEDLVGVPVIAGCAVRVPTFAKAVNFQVVRTIPSGPVVIGKRTDIRIVEGEQTPARAPAVSYEDIGGLERELARVREIVVLPLKYSHIFDPFGILAPKVVLLYGPPGTGKTLLARALAAESRVHFIHLNGPEVMRKFYGESEAKLREVFEEAARHAPAILFIDEIDAVAPKRADVVGDVEKRVVAQLLSLMDGFVSRGQVIVIGATNIPEVLDPALRRPGRFDREIEIGVPNTQGRLQILKIHTRAMPLGADVDLRDVAEHSHGFVGADLEALCQEVGMVALPRFHSKWLGESEKALREVFKQARRAAPCLLFFDTIDAVAPRLGADHFGADVYQRILSQLLREIDNLRDVKSVILLAATNRPERVEPALLRSGRFDYIVRFAKPDAADRGAIFRLCCRQVPLAPDVGIEALAERTEGLTGADLESLCKKATLLAIAGYQSDPRGRPFAVHARDFDAVLDSGGFSAQNLDPGTPNVEPRTSNDKDRP